MRMRPEPALSEANGWQSPLLCSRHAELLITYLTAYLVDRNAGKNIGVRAL